MAELDLNQEFVIPAGKYFNGHTYTAEEVMDAVGGDEKYYTVAKLQHYAEVMCANTDGGRDKFNFNECEDQMFDDLAEHLYTTK